MFAIQVQILWIQLYGCFSSWNKASGLKKIGFVNVFERFRIPLHRAHF